MVLLNDEEKKVFYSKSKCFDKLDKDDFRNSYQLFIITSSYFFSHHDFYLQKIKKKSLENHFIGKHQRFRFVSPLLMRIMTKYSVV